jgi:AAA+ superfamily predicted ATPase
MLTDQHLTDDQLLLCTTKVRGYSLSLKSWVTLDIANIKDIAWNDAAFPNLMLPAKYKSLVLAFVEGQISQRLSHQPAFDDIIEGKGQGVVMLLVGNPGTGKTLTAEAVADRVRRPLYVLSVGELGHGDDDMEMKLKATLKRTEKWNAVLLFDECDVLLQERSSSRLEHNELVTVFLRMLEYYRGIIIMTTNRVETMDKAFQSRIHLTLRYPDLDSAAKEHLWRYFVAQTQADSAITNEVYGRLAQLPLNGRQIKNTVKISMLLAAQEKEKLGIEYIDTVLQATMEMGTERT